jgi:iron complex outermembrane receptor protein
MQLFDCCNLSLAKRKVAKMFMLMKLTAFLLLAICLNASAIGNAQKVNLAENNVALNNVFREIKKQTRYTFVYTEGLLKKASKVSIYIKDGSLEEALPICFKEQPLTYTILNTMVVVKEKEEKPQPVSQTVGRRATTGSDNR